MNDTGSLSFETLHIPSGSGKMKCLVMRPGEQKEKLPALLWIHGGGYILGGTYTLRFSRARDIVSRIGAVALSPSYRLAGEAPYPAALEDCYAALEYIFEHADELGIDKSRVSVGGESAGGGLAAALCMYALDKGRYDIRSQLPLYPMLDCEDTDSSRDNHGRVWNTRRNHFGWKKYLGGLDPSLPVPAYASPARREDYRGLPPAYTFVCDGEPFYCETLRYIDELRKAGVPAQVDVYPGDVHSFDMLCPWLEISKDAREALIKAAEKLI